MILYRRDVGTLNDAALIELLRECLKKFNGFAIPHGQFIIELLGLLSRNGQEKKFILRFADYLSRLQEYGEDAIQGRHSSMEHLNGEQYLCSMRCNFSGSNVRILFAYINNKVYLLLAFSEKKGHRTTEYAAFCPEAKQRLQDMLKEEEE